MLSTKTGENFIKNRFLDDEKLLRRPDKAYREMCETVHQSKKSEASGDIISDDDFEKYTGEFDTMEFLGFQIE